MFWRTNYLEGAVDISRGELRDLLLESLPPLSDQFKPEHILQLLSDDSYHLMTREMVESFAFHKHDHISWMPYKKDSGDCDDFASLWYADMVKAWNKLAYRLPVALGLVVYKRFSGKMHKDGWLAWQGGISIYFAQEGKTYNPEEEISSLNYLYA